MTTMNEGQDTVTLSPLLRQEWGGECYSQVTR